MKCRRVVFGLILSLVLVILTSTQVQAQPLLIKLKLEKPDDWSSANSLGVIAYHRFDDCVLAEFERNRLAELDRAGLEYRIVDDDPWSEEYFLVCPVEGVAKADVGLLGKVLSEEPEWQLIKTSRNRAFELKAMRYKVTSIRHRPIPLEYHPPLRMTKPALKRRADIDDLLDLVSQDSLYTWDLRLQNFQTRYSYSDSIHSARQWLFDKLQSFGIDSVWFHYYFWDSDQYNVVATVVGTAQPDRVIVVGGHYDSVVYGGGTDPFVWAPGADDDGSGTVATLEMARIIAQNPLPVTVMFVPFAQEEQFLIGSDHFAEYLYNQNTDVELMINSDMIGHSVDLDPDVDVRGFSSAMPFVHLMMDMADTYTYLNPYYGGNWISDERSFYQWGYHSVGAIEGEFHYAGWHTNYDIVDSLDFDYMREVVKMCLATLLFVGLSPSTVSGLEAVDAGDGNTIYVGWSANDPAEDIAYYNLYFGTASGNYDSVRQITAASDTLRNLEENTTYFMAVTAINASGFESPTHQEVSMAPREVPRPPSELTANPLGTYKIKLDWVSNREADFDYYDVYRSEESGSGYQLVSGAHTDTMFVDSSIDSQVDYYYYALTAVDTSGNESQMSDETEGFAVTLDQGILVVDETYENIAFNMVEGDSIDAFYERALQGYTCSYADHSCPNCYPQNQLRLQKLGRYGVAIVHSEDNRGNRSLGAETDSSYAALREYLNYGGKVIIEGRRNLSAGDDGDWEIREFLPGEVPYDYLKIASAYVPPWSSVFERTEEFVGAASQISGYPDLPVDSLRVARVGGELELGGKVPGVGYIDNLMAGEIIYTFRSAYDTSSAGGKPVAFRYLEDDPQVIFFDFPLYFIREQQATELLHQALSDLGMHPTSADDEQDEVIASFSLKQNFPNPFNSETIIEYTLPKAGHVKIVVYNILGQRVRTLLDEKQTAGSKRIIWDGRNERGEEVSSGIYFYRLTFAENTATAKMVMMK